LAFVVSLVDASSGVAGHNALQLLLQHICVEIPDKAEYRHVAHATIGELMGRLYMIPIPGLASASQHAPRFLSFLLKYGRHKKPIFRLFAAEVAEELLLNIDFVTPVEVSTVISKKDSALHGNDNDDTITKTKKKEASRDAIDKHDARIGVGDDIDTMGVVLELGETSENVSVANALDVQRMDASADREAMEGDAQTEKESVPPTIVFSNREHFEMLCMLLSFLVERSSDKIVNVRAKALAAIATTLDHSKSLLAPSSTVDKSVAEHYDRAIRKVYFDTGLAPVGTDGAVEKVSETLPTVFKSPVAPRANSGSVGGQFSLVALIKRRLEDERSTVRKSALQLLETVCCHDRLSTLSHTLELFKNACFDPLLIIRKQASVSLTNLLARFENVESLVSVWVQSVPVLVFDAEQSVQEASLKSFVELVVERVLQTGNKRAGVDLTSDPLAWKLFDLITRSGSDANGKTMGKLCQLLATNGDYTPLAKRFLKHLVLSAEKLAALPKSGDQLDVEVIVQLKSELVSLEIAIWKTIALLVANPNLSPSLDVRLVLGRWNSIKNDSSVSVDVKLRILQSISCIVNEISSAEAKSIASDVLGRLESFSVQPSIIQASIQLHVRLVDRSCSECASASVHAKAEAASENVRWMSGLLSRAESRLAEIVVPSDQGVACAYVPTFAMLDALLFTVGEVCQFLPKNLLPGRLVTLLQTFISSSFKGILVSSWSSVARSASVASASPGGSSPGVTCLSVPASTRALAFVSLGKMCLQDMVLAKTCIAAFARELELSPSSVVRNNVMVVMCDLVVRYSNLVDNYLSKLTVCLRDESEMVRRQTLLMLTNLLQEEFIKLRQGNLFFPLLLTLVDESEVLRQFALICFENVLSKHGGASHVFFSNFIEAIFFLNDYRMHPNYNQYRYTARERQIFNLAGGGKNRAKRFTIYKLFFDHMEDQHKYQVSFTLCDEILQAFLDGQLPLEDAKNILYDTLCILSSEEIRLKNISAKFGRTSNAVGGSSTGGTGGGGGASGVGAEGMDIDYLDDDIGNAKNIENQKKIVEATGQLAAQVVKRTTIERIVPIFIDLKTLLAKHHSPLLKNVMDYLSDLIKDMPDEMAEVLENNKQLAMELAYETRLSRAIQANKSRKNGDSNADDEYGDEHSEQLQREEEEDGNGTAQPRRPKPAGVSKRHAQSLATVASAPTPWKRGAPEIGADFAVPKLRTGMTPYKPSSARSATDLNIQIDTMSTSPRAHVVTTPQTPKSQQTSATVAVLPPTTPGSISSPMANRMRRASIVIRTPSMNVSVTASGGDGSSSGGKSRASSSITTAFGDPSDGDFAFASPSSSRNAKRPRFIDSDEENDDNAGKASSRRESDPMSPMAKKPQSKRFKKAPEEEEAKEEERALVAESDDAEVARTTSETSSIALSPSRPSRPKRRR